MTHADLSHLRADFPIFTSERQHFLDSAASSQKPAAVIEAMAEFARTGYANVHRGAYQLSVESTERYEALRRRAAAFINAADADEVVVTRGTTTGLNMVAFGWGMEHLREGDRILLTMMEHHANVVPWQMVAKRTGARLDYVPLTADFRLDLDALTDRLSEEVKVVAVTGMSNVLGTMPPLDRVIDAAHRVGALVVVDGAQLVPHMAVDVQALGADFLAFSSHKMLGPTAIGVLWGRPDRLEEMEPFEGGGEMISDVQLDYSSWAAIPHRFEAGTPPIIEAVGFHAALDYLDKVGMPAVTAHDRQLTAYALERLNELPAVKVYGPADLNGRGGVISFTMGDIHPHDLATILDQEGVSVRAGHHCAKPLLRYLGVPATARASFHVYNNRGDVDSLIDALHKAGALFGVS
jgi:cysteine desulfurase / selenocysteine lyase